MRAFKLFFAALALTASAPAHGAIVARYGFASGTQTAPTAAAGASATSDLTTAGIAASSFSAASGLVGQYGTSSTNYTGFSTSTSDHIYVRNPGTGSTESGALTDDYYRFTVTPNGGVSYDLTSLTFSSDVTYGSGSTTFNGTVFVRSSVDNFATNLASYSEDSTTVLTFNSRTIDFASAASPDSYKNRTTATEFRLYFYDTVDTTTGNADVIRIDNVTLNANVVPEPASVGLLALAGAALLRRRRVFR